MTSGLHESGIQTFLKGLFITKRGLLKWGFWFACGFILNILIGCGLFDVRKSCVGYSGLVTFTSFAYLGKVPIFENRPPQAGVVGRFVSHNFALLSAPQEFERRSNCSRRQNTCGFCLCLGCACPKIDRHKRAHWAFCLASAFLLC